MNTKAASRMSKPHITVDDQFYGFVVVDQNRYYDADDGHPCGMWASDESREKALQYLREKFEEERDFPKTQDERLYAMDAIDQIDRLLGKTPFSDVVREIFFSGL